MSYKEHSDLTFKTLTPDDLYFAQGLVRTKALFVEFCDEPKKDYAVFTVGHQDRMLLGRKRIALQKLYTQYCVSDPTEYTFAMAVFGEWYAWTKVRTFLNTKRVGDKIGQWEREVAVAIKSRAMNSIVQEMEEGGRSSFSAAKFLSDRGWLDRSELSRKEKAELKKEEEELNKEAREAAFDADRLGLNIVSFENKKENKNG